ncbi:MAG: type II secretion system F family protein [Planctomycetota bacterium]
MPTFTYTARSLDGQRVTGSLSANTEREVISMLGQKSLFPIKVEQEKVQQKLQFSGRVSEQKIATFYSQLASLLKNGVPLLRSLSILREQASVPALQKALDDIVSRIEDGTPIGDAFGRHPKIFSDMAINMSKAGTEGGFLEEALERVALFTEQQAELKSRTVGALIYPAVLGTVGTLVVGVLVVYFVPKFSVLFDQLRQKGELPAVTDLLLNFSTWINKYGLFIAIAAVILFLVFRVQLQTPAAKKFLDRAKIKIPLFGPIFRNLAVSRFCRVLGTLLKNGVPILKALEISREAAGNSVLSGAIASATENITSGAQLSVPLAKSGHFPKNVTEMIAVAEESNTLDTVLVNIAEGLEKETTRRLDLMVKLLEPLMLMIMAVVVLIVVIALLMPIMKMGSVFQG